MVFGLSIAQNLVSNKIFLSDLYFFLYFFENFFAVTYTFCEKNQKSIGTFPLIYPTMEVKRE